MTTTTNSIDRYTPAAVPALRAPRAVVQITSIRRQTEDGFWLRAGILLQVRLGRLALQAPLAVARQADR